MPRLSGADLDEPELFGARDEGARACIPAQFRHFCGNLSERERLVLDKDDFSAGGDKHCVGGGNIPNAGKVVDTSVNGAESILGQI